MKVSRLLLIESSGPRRGEGEKQDSYRYSHAGKEYNKPKVGSDTYMIIDLLLISYFRVELLDGLAIRLTT